jgi:outer membrane protein
MKKCLTISLVCTSLFASENNTSVTSSYKEVPWGAGAVVRTTNIPFGTPFAKEEGEHTSSFIQLLYYQGEHFYMDGTEFGYRASLSEKWSLAAFTRLRFADIPEDLQNQYQLDGYDPGLQLRYTLKKGTYANFELMTDMRSNAYTNFYCQYTYASGDFEIIPYGNLGYKSSGYNTRYYGLEDIKTLPAISLGADIDFAAGVDLWYHMTNNFYLYGKIQTKFLSSEAKSSPYVSENRQDEFWLGFSFRNDKSKPLQQNLKSKPYFRLAYGFATIADIGEILAGSTIPDESDNHLVSLFYGHPLSDTFFNLPIPIYFTPGVAWHKTSDVQDNIAEFILALKAYYTIPLPWRVRLGVATGISYVTDTTYIEDIDMDPGEQSSKLLQHLGFSIDLNLGDIFGKNMENVWLGYDIHHRSAVFEEASEYGRFKGGSNYNTVYLQYHF